jgi:hypothetical protein
MSSCCGSLTPVRAGRAVYPAGLYQPPMAELLVSYRLIDDGNTEKGEKRSAPTTPEEQEGTAFWGRRHYLSEKRNRKEEPNNSRAQSLAGGGRRRAPCSCWVGGMPTRSVTSHSYKSPWPDKPEPGAVGAFGAWASGLTKSLQDAWVNTFGAEDGQGMTERVEVTVPSGVAAGEVFSVQVEGGGTFDVVVPSGVGTGDVVEVDVPMSLPPTSVEPSAEPTVPATPAVTEGSTEAPPSAMGSALPTTPGSRLPSQRGHEGGHELIKLPGRDSAPPTESPVGAFTGAWSHLPPAMPLMPPPLSKVGSHELAGCANYLGWRDEMVKLVDEGKKPPAALLTLLEASLHKLNDDDLREEYRWYAGQYMDDDASESLRNACEMIVIRIGEIVNMPQGASSRLNRPLARLAWLACRNRHGNLPVAHPLPVYTLPHLLVRASPVRSQAHESISANRTSG